MPARANEVPIPGSEKNPLPGARAVGAADPNERVEITVRVRPRKPPTAQAQAIAAQPPGQRQYLSRDEYNREYGADPNDLDKVEQFARARGLEVVGRSGPERSIRLAGTARAMSEAFGVELQRYDSPQGSFRGRTGPVHVPAELRDIVSGVHGLDDRPQAQPRLRQRGGELRPANAADGSFTPPEVAQLYGFPGVNGQGQTIGIIELGGGFTQADLDAYFGALGIPTPQVTAVPVDLGQNQPGDPADGEVLLDIEVAGAVAPGANIVVYFADNSSSGFLDAVTTAIHDSANNPSVISISWGNAEVFWTQQAIQDMDQAFQAAALLGVTVCCASGDNGSNDGVPRRNQSDGSKNVDFPASSPFALGCGGTRLNGSGTSITSEVVWNDAEGATGGGVSNVFTRPSWQANANVPPGGPGDGGRGVPDVSGNADPETGFQVLVDGQNGVIGGTSAVAPLWAGLIALFNQSLGQSVGFLNPVIYGLPANAGAFRDITVGNNGAFQAGTGWDACTGLGSPNGAILLRCLQDLHNPSGERRPTGRR